MNVKEIAQAVGKDERTVRRWIRSVAVKMSVVADKASASTSTHPADYTLDEVLVIIEKGMGKNAASLFRANAENRPNETDRLDRLEKMVENLIMVISQNIITNKPSVKQIESVPEISPRNRLNQLVRSHCDKTEEPHGMAWNRLYNSVYYRMGINVGLRAKNVGISGLDYLDKNNLIEKVIIIAQDLFQK